MEIYAGLLVPLLLRLLWQLYVSRVGVAGKWAYLYISFCHFFPFLFSVCGSKLLATSTTPAKAAFAQKKLCK